MENSSNLIAQDRASRDTFENESIEKAVLENPWRNTYWFARILINGDKYGAVGKEIKLLTEICLGLRKIIEDKAQADTVRVNLSKRVIKELFDKRFVRQTAKTERINLFYNDLLKKLNTMADITVFTVTAENILIPINQALESIPNNDREFTMVTAKAYLDELGNTALATEILSKYRIKQIWHLVTYDEDLSDDKLALLGGLRHVFYLRDDSRRLAYFKQHIGLKEYVRPISQFIADLEAEQKDGT
jgi:hypothetical protein